MSVEEDESSDDEGEAKRGKAIWVLKLFFYLPLVVERSVRVRVYL